MEKTSNNMALHYAKIGLFLGAISGIIWSIDGIILGNGLAKPPCNWNKFWLLAPLFAAGFHDLIQGILSLFYNCYKGKQKEIIRTIASKPGKLCILAALIGAPFGIGSYIISISLVGAAYALPITSLYPAVATILAFFFLKEKITKNSFIGLFSCVAGAIIISYLPPQSVPQTTFNLGILFAIIAACGWAIEGVCIASATDFIDPTIAMCVNKCTSGIFYLFFLIPGLYFHISNSNPEILLHDVITNIFNNNVLFYFFIAGICGCITYLCLYSSYNAIGVSRGMALNITSALWGVIISYFVTDLELTYALIIGSIIIVIGMLFVIGNPKELISLRNV